MIKSTSKLSIVFRLYLRPPFGTTNEARYNRSYKQDRLQHPDTRMYTLHPKDEFALAEIFRRLTLVSSVEPFEPEVFRGHVERSPNDMILSDIIVQIKRVIFKHEFNPKENRPEHLEYILFGTPDELFLAHHIVVPGDFDQILPVRIADQNSRMRIEPRITHYCIWTPEYVV